VIIYVYYSFIRKEGDVEADLDLVDLFYIEQYPMFESRETIILCKWLMVRI